MASALSPSVPSKIVIAVTAIVVALTPACTCARPAKETATKPAEHASASLTTTPPEQMPAATRGMWAWATKGRLEDPNGTSELVKTCHLANLNEIYLSVNNGVLDDARLPALMTALRESGVRIEALMGDAGWYEPEARAPMRTLIGAVAAYDRKHTDAPFAAIHLDIEPHQKPENRGEHRFLPALAETLREAHDLAAREGLATSADLPRFAFDEAGPSFSRTGVRPFVMLYQLRDPSAPWLARQSGNVLDHAYAGIGDDIASRTVIGLRVEDYPADLETMVSALDQAHASRARYGGWAIHDEAKYRARTRP